MRIAFFDLDKTLIAKNSASLWVRSELRDGFITLGTAMRGFGWIARYHLGASDLEPALRYAVQLMTGQLEADMRARTQAFFHRDVRRLYRPGALEAVKQHRARGDAVVLLTTSSDYLCHEVCTDLGLDGFVSNRFEVDSAGRYTGLPIEPLCFGPGKVLLAEQYAKRHAATLDECTFYSDSTSDLPMLRAAGSRVVVNPDQRLRRIAKREGWPVVDWGEGP